MKKIAMLLSLGLMFASCSQEAAPEITPTTDTCTTVPADSCATAIISTTAATNITPATTVATTTIK